MAVRVERVDGVGLLTLDRPQKAHAYDRAHLEALAAGFAELEGSVPVVVVQSTGDGAFCGGADLHELREVDPLAALDLRSQAVFTRIARSPVLTIAAVHGAAVGGGCELALACDLRIVGARARFALPELAHGLTPAAGGCTRLTRLVGPSIAKQVILFGHTLDADAAARCGLALGPVEDPRAEAKALALRQVVERDPLAARLAKQVIDRSEDPASLEAERVGQSLLYHRRGARLDASIDGLSREES